MKPQRHISSTIFHSAATPQVPLAVVAEQKLEPMGRFYIHNAAPMKGAKAADDGRCFFLLQCFEIPQNATPGQVRDMQFKLEQAQYHVFYGHMSRKSGDTGLVVGYVEDCEGTRSLSDITPGPVMTKTTGIMMPRPQVTPDWNAPRFGNHESRIQNFDETIATMADIDARRNRGRAPSGPRLRCLGGK